jgi:BirA family transcriptional regulator, biotin operon repressor / biotin---[acetyl-CoA-carboxylase] ligase
MDEARRRFDGLPTLVTAARQTRGRGRSGREWVHADRAVAASLAIRSGWPAARRPLIPLVAGVAAASVFDARLKWPNDLITDLGKVGGLLVESDGDVEVVGLGVNLWWPDPVEGAAALHTDDPGPGAGAALAERWALLVVAAVDSGPDRWDRSAYESLCATIGRDITWDPAGSGRAVGVDSQGRLVVETQAGTVALDSGEVRHVRAH